MGNWVETRVATNCPQLPARFDATTTQRADYNPQVRLLRSVQRQQVQLHLPAHTPVYLQGQLPVEGSTSVLSLLLLATVIVSVLMQGKFGAEVMTASSSDRLGRTYACTHRDLLFKHGDKARPPCSSFCSLNELTMGMVADRLSYYCMCSTCAMMHQQQHGHKLCVAHTRTADLSVFPHLIILQT